MAGSGGVTLTVTGTKFYQGATVLWAGVALQTTVVSGSELQATVPSSLLKAPRESAIFVSNGSTGGSSFNSLTFTVLPATSGSTNLSLFNLAAEDVTWDAASGQLILPVWSADPQYPNHIVAIDPETVSVSQSVAVTPDPYLVRVTDDDTHLYTGFMTVNQMTQLTLPDLGSPSSWKLPSRKWDGPCMAWDVQPAYGEPETVAVSEVSSSDAMPCGITIYDSGVARP